MNRSSSAKSQVGLEQLKSDSSVVSVLETFPILKTRENSSIPLKQYVVLEQDHQYLRTLKRNGEGYLLESRLPFRDFKKFLKPTASRFVEDFLKTKIEYDPGNRLKSILDRTALPIRRKKPVYSTDVRYLAYRKICRIFEDGKKQLGREDRAGAQLLLGICLLHLARYHYIHQNRPIPSLGRMADELQKGIEPLRSIIRRFPSRQHLSESFNRIASLLQEYQSDYPWNNWKWESKPLRFGKGFSFEGLVFPESENPVWKIRDRLWKSPPKILPWFEKHRESISQLKSAQEVREELVRILEQIPGVEGALIMGSQAQASFSALSSTGSDLDLVIFVRGLYLKRFFFMIDDIPLDGVVLSGKVAEMGVRRGAAMAVNGFANGAVILDSNHKYTELSEIAKDRFGKGPVPVPQSEIDYALLRLQALKNYFGFTEEDTAIGIRFLFLEQLVSLLHLISQALGIWFVGEQRIFPSLEEKAPEVGLELSKILDRYSQHPGEVLQGFFQSVNHRFNRAAFPQNAESHYRFTINQLFDF